MTTNTHAPTILYPILDEITKRLNRKHIHLALRASYTNPLLYYIACTKSDTKNNKIAYTTLTTIKLENNEITISETIINDNKYHLSDPQIITKLTTIINTLIENSDYDTVMPIKGP